MERHAEQTQSVVHHEAGNQYQRIGRENPEMQEGRRDDFQIVGVGKEREHFGQRPRNELLTFEAIGWHGPLLLFKES